MKEKKQNNLSLLFVIVVLFLVLPVLALPSRQIQVKPELKKIKITVEHYIQQGRFASAQTFCRNQTGKFRGYCYLCMVDAYLDIDKYKIALEWCNKLLVKGKEKNSPIYLRMGRAYLGLGDYTNALIYFEKAGPSEPSEYQAVTYKWMADQYYLEGDYSSAKTYYKKALNEYRYLIKHFFSPWPPLYSQHLRKCLHRLERLDKTDIEKKELALLARVLEGAGQYCEKMRKAVFHCFCHEKVKETLAVYGPEPLSSRPPMANTYLYEYQLLQEGKKVLETRTLLKQNGVPRKKENAKLQIHGCKYQKLVFGPLELVAKYRQEFFYYKILAEEELWGEPAVVIEAIPRFYSDRLFGKIWVSTTDFSVMKIEWTPKSISHSRLMEERARRFNAIPRVTFFAEFKFKRQGIRFPTKYFLEETYILANKREFDRLLLDVTFKDYMFFVVGSEVTETKMMKKKLE
jgi:tetratricopeptide (TPR) repeat protein